LKAAMRAAARSSPSRTCGNSSIEQSGGVPHVPRSPRVAVTSTFVPSPSNCSRLFTPKRAGAGRAREASTPIAAALSLADSGQLPPGFSRNLRREALRVRVAAEAQMHDAAAAQKTADALEKEASVRGDDPVAQTAMHYARGQLALAQNDLAGARAHFDQCSVEDQVCKWQGVVAAEKAGDKAAAAAQREQLLQIYQRNAVHLIIRTRLVPVRTT
jgi:hypothetical protein